jgi:hypothetical protein
MLDLYKSVPKELEANLRYRIDLRRRAAADDGFRRAMLTAAKHDFLWWLNSWCWLFEPRPRIVNGRKLPNMIPFITWQHQDPVILSIRKNIGHEDITLEKARGEGASWIGVLLAVHDFLFDPMSAIGVSSRTEAAMDNSEDPDSLMWKMDWELSKLPKWMVPKYERNQTKHTFYNPANHSTIAGYAATGDMGSGGRKKWWLMDELAKFPREPAYDAMASTQHVTNSRFVPSTPKGSAGAFYDLTHEPSSIIKLVLDWKDNPTRNRGLYDFRDGKPVAIDPVNNPLAPAYDPPNKQTLDLFSRLRKKGFKLEGRQRSPWYDHECDRPGATPQNIAQELDRDYGGSMHRVFGAEFTAAAQKHVRPPLTRGILSYHPETLEPEFEISEDGPVKIWLPLDNNNKPPAHPYVLGADVATGLGGSYTSNSSVTAIDQVTMEQVVEITANTIPPADFADLCMALGKWLYDAYLAAEANGPGAGFIKRVLDKRYHNLYHRPILYKRGRKKTKEVGWWTDTKSKEAMFGELSRSVKAGEVQLHSAELVAECGQYVYINGKIEHVLGVSTDDDSSKGTAHGDRVIGCGVCLMAARDRPLGSAALKEQLIGDPKPGTMAYRDKEYQDTQKRQSPEWDDRSTFDLAHGDLAGSTG